MLPTIEILSGKKRLRPQLGSHPGRRFFRQGTVAERNSIDKNPQIPHFNFIAGNPDHPFDQARIIIARKANHDIATIRLVPLRNSKISHRNAQIIRK